MRMEIEDLLAELESLSPAQIEDAATRLRSILAELPDSHAELRPVITAFLVGYEAGKASRG